MSSACGKKGPPLAPVRIGPAPPGQLRVRQIGPEVVLSAVLPGTRNDHSRLGPDAAVRVLRLQSTGTLRPEAVSERYLVQQFQKQAATIASLTGEDLRRSLVRGRFVFGDGEVAKATATAEGAPPRFLYALQIVEGKNSRSPLRVPTQIEIGSPPPAPVDLRAEAAEGAVRLEWTPGAGPAAAAAPESAGQVTPPDTSPPGGQEPPAGQAPGAGQPPAAAAPPTRGFNVYRKEAGDSAVPEDPLNPKPLAQPSFVDTTFRYDVGYVYFVRAVDSPKGTLRESVASPPVEVRPHDRFAPAAPTGLAVAVEGAVIRVYWFPNAEPDLAGYRVYRRTTKEKEPVRIGETPATETSFIDPGTVPGVRYHYSVSAVDGADPVNESPRSEERSELLSGGGAE
ncbi:MAG TPA: fibronectin type III domain-containing protein [Candidatus Cryosericum sp.]|nr:fibronectin type III domain-containing protein [Candidatus Cryosericum sp.]